MSIFNYEFIKKSEIGGKPLRLKFSLLLPYCRTAYVNIGYYVVLDSAK